MSSSSKKNTTLSHMSPFCEQILNGPAPLKCMTSKIRAGAEKLIPLVLIFKRSLNVRSTTFPLSQSQFWWTCLPVKLVETSEAGSWGSGGFSVAFSPSPMQHFHALNYLISGFFSLLLAWFESLNADFRIVGNRTVALFVKTKQSAASAFAVM